MFDYSVGLNEIVQLMIRTIAPPSDDNNNGKQNQEETKKSVNEETDDSAMQVNGHVSIEDQVCIDQ